MSVKVDELIGSNGSVKVDDLIDLLSNLSGSSQVGEDILKAPLAVDVRTILQLVKQTSLVDATAGRMLEVGSFGLGAGTVAPPYLTNLDSITTPNGFYYVDLSTTGTFPTGLAFSGSVFVERHATTNYIMQTMKLLGGGSSILNSEFYRAYNASTGTWNTWARNFNSNSILGNVSQSSGVPTGAILEKGSNSNGKYLRLADGTQLCWGDTATATASGAYGSGYASPAANFTYPAAFIESPAVFGNTINQSNPIMILPDQTPTTTGNGIRVFAFIQNATAAVRWFAIGRWY